MPGITYAIKINHKEGWIGIKEKSIYIMFIIYTGKIYKNAYKNLEGPMEVYDWDEDLWLYSKLAVADVLKEGNFENQKNVIKNWLNRDIKNIL